MCVTVTHHTPDHTAHDYNTHNNYKHGGAFMSAFSAQVYYIIMHTTFFCFFDAAVVTYISEVWQS